MIYWKSGEEVGVVRPGDVPPDGARAVSHYDLEDEELLRAHGLEHLDTADEDDDEAFHRILRLAAGL